MARAIRNAIRANRFARIIRNETPIFIARQADSHESLEFPIRANHPIRASRANRFARITPLSIAQKGVRAIDARNSQLENGSCAAKTSVRAPGLSTDEREHPFV